VGKKLLILVICVIAFIALSRSGVLDSLKPKKITFEAIESQFEKDGFQVTGRQSTSLINGAVEGEQMTVNGMLVRAFRFVDSGRLSIEYENNKPGVGDGIAQSMGITTSLGLQSRPVSGPETYPGKKGLHLIIVHSNDKAAARGIIDSFSKL
jgi:hypothetical protein